MSTAATVASLPARHHRSLGKAGDTRTHADADPVGFTGRRGSGQRKSSVHNSADIQNALKVYAALQEPQSEDAPTGELDRVKGDAARRLHGMLQDSAKVDIHSLMARVLQLCRDVVGSHLVTVFMHDAEKNVLWSRCVVGARGRW